jgi:Essential protein Yae1, N terminal
LTESRFYKEGYDEGYADGLESGPEEGREFGYEVAFQKFLPLGIILGRCSVWKRSLAPDSLYPVALSDTKKARALKQIELLESMILGMDKQNESEAEHGKFDEMKTKIINKSRVVESLMGEEHSRHDHGKEGEQEDQITLAKRMDRELQL